MTRTKPKVMCGMRLYSGVRGVLGAVMLLFVSIAAVEESVAGVMTIDALTFKRIITGRKNVLVHEHSDVSDHLFFPEQCTFNRFASINDTQVIVKNS